MKDAKSVSRLTSRLSGNCQICGDIARGFNYNVITCMSCKSFFRRNALKRSSLHCEFKDECIITKHSRGFCSTCRLKKCLALGMDPVLIRNIPSSKMNPQNIRSQPTINDPQHQLPRPLPLSLLRNDRSMMTSNEWTLLSNVLHAFDAQKSSVHIRQSLDQLSSLPPKFRMKPFDTYNIVSQFFTNIKSLIERLPDLHSLSVDARRALTKHNLNAAGSFNGIFLCRELDLYNNPVFLNACNTYYGPEHMMECVRNSARCDPNGSLVKMMLFIMTLSSNCSIVVYDDQENIQTISSSIDLIRIQNIYVTMLWKYLLYLYGFKEATLRFACLVKNIIDVTHMLEVMPKNTTHEMMVDTIVTKTERVLLITS